MRGTLMAALAVGMVGLAVGTAVTGSDVDDWLDVLGTERYHELGLHKLSPEERGALRGLWAPDPVPSYLEYSAVRYLEEEDWRPVRVVGRVPDRISGYDLLVADGYDLLVLDPWGSPDPLPPGVFWGRNTLSSWTIIEPDGDEIDFRAE
jgi:hypothetical protein